MRQRLVRVLLSAAMLVGGAFPASVLAQGLTGQISGTVTDAGGGVMPGATVSIKNAGTNQTRESVTGADGSFTFPDLLAGNYDITVAVQGFKTYEQKGIVLGATERVALRTIALEVGQLQETVTVTSDLALVQTTNAARSGLVDRTQIDDIAVKGRDFASYLKLLPGVVDTSAREAPGWGSMGGLSINGRSGGFNFSYDGVTNKDTGSNSGNYAAPALDSIAEVRVQTSNFQAEYGRSSGATVTVITRSGSKDFHGSAAFYKRDDALNGNEFSSAPAIADRVSTSQCKPPDYDVRQRRLDGGRARADSRHVLQPRPQQAVLLLVAGHPRRAPIRAACSERRMPTRARAAAATSRRPFDNQRRLLFIRDPQLAGNCNVTTGGPACFPGNVIPGNRINHDGAGAAQPLPAAQRDAERHQLEQLHLPDRAGLAAQRPGAARRLQHRAEHDDVRTAAVRV